MNIKPYAVQVGRHDDQRREVDRREGLPAAHLTRHDYGVGKGSSSRMHSGGGAFTAMPEDDPNGNSDQMANINQEFK